MVPIAYASGEGSDEPAHPRKIASAFTAHIHNKSACRGCEFKIGKALEMIGTSRNLLYLPHVCRSMYTDFVTCEDQQVRIQRGGQGVRTPPPLENHKLYGFL